VHALLEEISIGQVLTYAGRAAEARATIEDLLARAHQTGNPTTLSWAYYIAEEAIADADAERAVVAARDRYPTLTPDDQRLEAALARVRRRLGPRRTDAILADGAALTRAATLTRARAAIQAARQRMGPGP
jgi:hypothetical protein